jgi:hypothetical protein
MNGETGEKIAGRYPMSFALRYVMAASELARKGVGETVWMGSRELAFLSKGPLEVGDKVMLHIEWPVLLQDQVPLQLTVTAEIAQRSGPLSVAKITKYEFRTRGIQSPALQPVPAGARHCPPIPAWEALSARRMTATKAFGSAPGLPEAVASAGG